MAKAKTYGKANDKYANFKDEFTLAQLIQNAAARGLTSTRGALFRKSDKSFIDIPLSEQKIARTGGALLRKPPKDATCACAMGAQALTPKVKNPLKSIVAITGNDTSDDEGEYLIIKKYADQRSYDIGAAYEQALRPD